MLSDQDYADIAFAVNERRLESRNVARRKVIELTADIARVLYRADAGFDIYRFYRACGFTDEDIRIAEHRTVV